MFIFLSKSPWWKFLPLEIDVPARLQSWKMDRAKWNHRSPLSRPVIRWWKLSIIFDDSEVKGFARDHVIQTIPKVGKVNKWPGQRYIIVLQKKSSPSFPESRLSIFIPLQQLNKKRKQCPGNGANWLRKMVSVRFPGFAGQISEIVHLPGLDVSITSAGKITDSIIRSQEFWLILPPSHPRLFPPPRDLPFPDKLRDFSLENWGFLLASSFPQCWKGRFIKQD